MKPAVYKNYLLLLLVAILALTYMDRMVFGIVQQDIKTDLHLTDTELGILTGLAFTVFYSLLGIPIARWADRGNRITVISVTAAVWGISLALCSRAGSFLQLLVIRIGIAAGESGCAPPATSLIPEYFSRAERPRAMARFMMGIPIGLILGFVAGGWLNQLYGWRMTFVILGIPGILLGLLVALTLKEPRRQSSAALAEQGIAPLQQDSPPPLKVVVATLWANKTFRNLLACFMVWYFAGWAIIGWQATFFIRSHGISTGKLGMWLALGQAGRLLGTWLGGEWATRYASNNERKQLTAIAVLFVFFCGTNAAALFVSNAYLAFIFVAIGAVGEGAVTGPIFSTLQTLVAPRMRATAVSLIQLFPSFIGNGLGPIAVGMLSDAMHPWAGEESLRYALLMLCPLYCWTAFHCWRASRTVTQDVAARLNAPV